MEMRGGYFFFTGLCRFVEAMHYTVLGEPM